VPLAFSRTHCSTLLRASMRATLNSYARATPFHVCARCQLRAESKHLL
jgi:hypothetical protein